jgi:hypothetical protein
MSKLASASFSKSAATLEAAAAAVFGNSESELEISNSATSPKAAEALLGLSCVISAHGKVKSCTAFFPVDGMSTVNMHGNF